MWKPQHETLFEKIQGRIVANTAEPEEFKKGNRGASAKSSGFTKKAWKEVGGYPENLYTAEDTKFCAKILEKGYPLSVAENAYVNWHMRPNYKEYFKQFYKYGEGDAKAGALFTHPNKKLGITKNLLLVTLIETRIIALLATIITAIYRPTLTPITLAIFLTTIIAVWIYDYRPLKKTLAQDGLKPFITGLILSQMKVTAWYLGFAKENIKNPKLIVKQFTELRE